MLFYIFLLLTALYLLKEIKKPTQRKKLIFGFACIFGIGFMYHLGEVTGIFLYHLGVSI